ncbi:MAG: hypothetical protein RLZZ127_2763 [Planctomycetota bacterium]|jgi:hypothetical protein
MDPLDRFAADAVAALRGAVAATGPAALVWHRDREGLALVGLVQAAWGGACPFPVLVEPGTAAAADGWRERVARSWDLDMVRLDAAAGHGVVPGSRLDRLRGRWEPVVSGPHPVLITGLWADADPGAGALATVMPAADGTRIHPLLDWDDRLLDGWLARLGVPVPGGTSAG